MNGQTGKMIGDYPVDKKKAVLLGIGVFVLCMLISVLLFFIGVI